MSVAVLERKDNLHLLNSYIRVYETNKLYKMKIYYRKIMLRIVKKSILGTNFIYLYFKHTLFKTALFNMIIINLNLILFPKLFYNSKSNANFSNDKDFQNESEIYSPNYRLFTFNKTIYIIFRIFIINILDIFILSVMAINYNYKQKIINKYMEVYTQCAIRRENKLIKKRYYCSISNDGKFNIEIYSTKKIKNKGVNYNRHKYFFEYVINVPNIRLFSPYAYKKILLPKEIEIINRIATISNEIEYRYKKKLLRFLLIIIFVIIYIPLKNIISEEKNNLPNVFIYHAPILKTKELQDYNIFLMLCGHKHGGWCFPFTLLIFLFKKWIKIIIEGLYSYNDKNYVYCCSGLGTSGPNSRCFIRANIGLILLEGNK